MSKMFSAFFKHAGNIAGVAVIIAAVTGFSGHHMSMHGGGMAHPASIHPIQVHPIQIHPIEIHPMSRSFSNPVFHNFEHREFERHDFERHEMRPLTFSTTPANNKVRVGIGGSGSYAPNTDWPYNVPDIEPTYSPIDNAHGFIENGRLYLVRRPRNSQEYLEQHDWMENIQSGGIAN
jgi:hypothetical protein